MLRSTTRREVAGIRSHSTNHARWLAREKFVWTDLELEQAREIREKVEGEDFLEAIDLLESIKLLVRKPCQEG